MNDIFENQLEVQKNIIKSAEELGHRPPQESLVAKKNCKHCYGEGYLLWSFPGNKGDNNWTPIMCKCVRKKEI